MKINCYSALAVIYGTSKTKHGCSALPRVVMECWIGELNGSYKFDLNDPVGAALDQVFNVHPSTFNGMSPYG